MNTPTATASHLNFLASGGEMGRRIREFDWSQTPLAAPAHWPQSLRSALGICLGCGFPIAIYWGRELALFYNDAWSPIPADKHPWALGRPAREVWPEIWGEIGPLFAQVRATGEPVRLIDQLLPMRRRGFTEECYFDFTFSPIRDEDGAVGGIFNAAVETTSRVLAERRGRLLRDLATATVDAPTPDSAATLAAGAFGGDLHDLPFTLLYLAEDDGSVRLAASSGLSEVALAGIPARLGPNDPAAPWSLGRAWRIEDRDGVVLGHEALAQFNGALRGGPWPEPPAGALLHALPRAGGGEPAGFFLAGLSPRLALDEEYRGFIAQAASGVAAALERARSSAAERERAEKLAELDRAKTAFFSNVSHEFRTPLTLLLGPLEEMAAKSDEELLRDGRGLVTVAQRNGLRLLKLVNSLLDFARLEAGRTRAHFEPTDLAAYTAELASSFRSAMEKAGLDFKVECPPLADPVYLDREMWEKIVLNLLSNAFKFTLAGEVRVTVRAFGAAVEMTVRDTGAGIPAEAMPHLFERFYRVQGAPGRTHEGSGIGLALVHELVKLHGGTVRAESEAGRGSAFIVSIPRGSAHLPGEQCADAPATGRRGKMATAFVAEALRWLPDNAAPGGTMFDEPEAVSDLPPSSPPRPRILLADDNADMRDYVARLLSPRFDVIAVADGQSALAAALDERPELVLTDVMMPRLDGFGLLRKMRADLALQAVPVILLSARAGEEARVEGLEAGADDYLTKPFHARELLAKVNGTLTLAKVRAEALAREAELRAERTEILESMNLGFMALDGDFRIVYLNAEAGRLYGLTQEKYFGQTHWEAFPASNGTAVESNIRRAMTERIPVRFENFYEPWQQWFEINAYPMTGGRLGVFFRDITERKQAETVLRQNEALFSTLIEQAPLGVYVVDAQFRLQQVNSIALPAFEKVQPLIGRDFSEIMDILWGAEIGGELARIFRSTLETGERYVSPEFSAPRQDLGEERAYDWETQRVTLPDGQRGVVCYFTDVTERRRAEAALQEAKAAAEAANSSKDRFLAVLSHELRTPLTPVLMAIGALEHDPALSPEVREYLAMMKRNIELETKLIDDLLDLNRITSGKLPLHLEPLDLNEAVREVCNTCRPPLRDQSMRLETQLDEAAGLVAADRARLQQVLWNVLKNAIKFTPEEGAIRVTTQRLDRARCEVRVQDSGIGIPAEVLPRIFNAFEQGDAKVTRQFGGLGLGLAICKALVELHHGSIRAESAGPGQGSTFIIELPGATPAALAKPDDAALVEEGKTRQLRLLLVEDHADTALTLSRLLRRAGFVVVAAADVASAAARAEAEAFDVLISDLGLPDGSGYEVIRRVRAHQIVPGIAMSGYGMDEDVRRTREAGFTEHLVKPVEVTQLIAAIRRVAKDRG